MRYTGNAGNQQFSSAVFRENPRYCYSPGVVVVVQKLRHLEISLLLLKIYVLLSKEQSILSRETIQNAFFRIMPLFRLRLFILYQAPHIVGTRMRCSCFLCNNVFSTSREKNPHFEHFYYHFIYIFFCLETLWIFIFNTNLFLFIIHVDNEVKRKKKLKTATLIMPFSINRTTCTLLWSKGSQ